MIKNVFTATVLLLFPASALTPSTAADFNTRINEALSQTEKWPGLIRSDLGVTRRGTKIPCLITADDLDYNTKKTRILIVGLETLPAPVETTLNALQWFYTTDEAKPYRETFALSAVPIANPDGWASRIVAGNLSGGDPARSYPPKGTAYNSPTDPEAAYLWRWIGMHAPDLVISLGSGSTPMMFVPEKGGPQLQPLRRLGVKLPESSGLVSQLVKQKPANVGTVPAIRIDTSRRGLPHWLRLIMDSGFSGPSAARQELQRRLARTPIEVASQLSQRYGHDLSTVAYIPALALIGRIRLGALTDDPSHLANVEKIVAPYFNGDQPTFGKRVGGSSLSGHLVFGELARFTEKKRYVELAKAAADLGFDENGHPKQSMPFHNEMSDAVFMGTPILVQVGRLTGQPKYYDMALKHMRFMLKLNLRKDGLHRHSPLDETAWGRGNGFPALGLTLSLSDLPQDHAGRGEMLREFRGHLAALVKHQDPTGMWHQVVDHTGSYRELSCTCMITFAMIRGVRCGWLDEKTYRPILEKSFQAVLARIAADGTLVDVCTGTGKQQDLRAYLDRTAILGPDPRGGAMSLLMTAEMAAASGE